MREGPKTKIQAWPVLPAPTTVQVGRTKSSFNPIPAQRGVLRQAVQWGNLLPEYKHDSTKQLSPWLTKASVFLSGRGVWGYYPM
jgi:hypothetical protein